jgi:peptidoglycan/LPS O-acetylase OafA/YrhL
MGVGADTRSRVAALTGLRGLAAASVVLYHAWLYGAPGAGRFPTGPLDPLFAKLDIGVTFFFVLSGFLLYRPFARAIVSGDALPLLRHFAIARFLRIVPVYWVAVLVVALAAERHLFDQPWRLLANLLFLEFSFPSFLPDNYATDTGSIAIVPSWALVVELGFYVTLPVLCLLAAWLARGTIHRIAAAFVPAAVLAVVGAIAIVIEHRLSGDVRRAWLVNFPMHASAFACGMAGTTIWILRESGRVRLARWWQAFVAIAALAIALPSLKLVNTGHLSLHDARWPIAVSFTLLLLLVVFSPPRSRVHSILGTRILAGVGLASYSIFLVHDTVIRTVRTQDIASTTFGGFLITLTVVSAATAVLAFLSYKLLEKPCFRLKRHLVQPRSAAPLQELLERLVVDVAPSRGQEVVVDATRAPHVAEPHIVVSIVKPLFENAIAYGAAPFVVEASSADGELCVVVKDSGRGIDEAFVPRLFEPRARSELSSAVPGDGLGLATARAIARGHGGEVLYVPRPEEAGARFAVSLPLGSHHKPQGRVLGRLVRRTQAGAERTAAQPGWTTARRRGFASCV